MWYHLRGNQWYSYKLATPNRENGSDINHQISIDFQIVDELQRRLTDKTDTFIIRNKLSVTGTVTRTRKRLSPIINITREPTIDEISEIEPSTIYRP